MFIDSTQHGLPTNRSCTLDRLCIGQSARVTRVGTVSDDAVRLMEMGLVPGTEVTVARVAPLGDPIDVVVRGYHLSLRRSEAREVTVLPKNGEGDVR